MKSIILLLIGLFVFCINLEHKQSTIKQNDTIITQISNHDAIITASFIDINTDNSFEYTNYIYPINYLNTNVISNHFVATLVDNLVISNLTKVQGIYIAKTIGLQYVSNIKYFNIYLYHKSNKLGFT